MSGVINFRDEGIRPQGGVALLRVQDLRVQLPTEDGVVRAVDGISYELHAGRTLGIVGESGSGKTVSALALMGLQPKSARLSGRIDFDGRELLALDSRKLRALRGDELAMIFQDPLSSLHPLHRVGWQLVEAIRAHRDVAKAAARERAAELLDLVGIPDPRARLRAYPHELSGGQRQRVMIAMALANEPKLLIADEPTTALDVTVQAQILALLKRLQRELGMAMVFVTHDLGVVAEIADEVAVMYAGRIVERGSTERVLSAPSHPYTWGLLRSIPRLEGGAAGHGPASGAARDSDRGSVGELEPIAGRPPSLISPPSGCHFHPRCPYALPEHARVDPVLAPIPGEPSHRAACLLESAVRAALWSRLRDGESVEQARAGVELVDIAAPPGGATAGLANEPAGETHG
ncbi:MAG TPA: ABC transporter ATP-binding protein [Solirubrobacteraceae bacterium]|jgi:peptide/nickel transport system ATP-binding protein